MARPAKPVLAAAPQLLVPSLRTLDDSWLDRLKRAIGKRA